MPLEELDYDYTVHERERAGDEKLYVRFFTEVMPDEEASKTAGIRKFRDAVMITIVVPGDQKNIIVREARADDIERFPEHYKKFQAGAEEQLSGYPLKEWPLISRSIAEELKYLGFRTVEQLVGASSGVAGKYPGMLELQRRGAAWLAAQQNSAPLEKMQTELQERDKEIAAMKAQIEEMTKALAALKKAA